MQDNKKPVELARLEELARLAKTVRYWSLYMTTKAGSGHPTSSLSATDLMVALFFNRLKYDLENPQNPNNDRVIFSKGHASPLFYALYKVGGAISQKDIDTYREFGSKLEGHPTPRFKYAEAATGSLGQGLPIGVGEALAAKVDNLLYFTYVLLGDSEMAEGSVWEALEIAAYYKLDNLVGIIDVNRLGQRGETMHGWDVDVYRQKIEAFGWETHLVDGHNFSQIEKAFELVQSRSGKPKMVIAKTIKGKGVPFLEDRDGWHGKALSKEDFEKAVKELGKFDKNLIEKVQKPTKSGDTIGRMKESPLRPTERDFAGQAGSGSVKVSYDFGEHVATRKAYGETLAQLGKFDPRIVALDGEVSNSTFAQLFKSTHPERFFEMFIAEQNMVGVALGLSKRGKIPFVSTFSAFFTRAFDQIRMSAISGANIKFVGSHAGVSIGEDGPSQMGLEDLALFRAVFASTVFCPADAVSCAKIVEIAASNDGIFYIRTQRPDTPVIYENNQEFKIGGSNIVVSTKDDKVLVVACGICVIEAMKAADILKKEGINIRVMDAYSIKPMDEESLRVNAKEVGGQIITCEDHYFEGGLGDAVLNVFAKESNVSVHKLAVLKMPMSGKTSELLNYEEINADFIKGKIRKILR